MRTTVTKEEAIARVIARRTKGDAFRLDHDAYFAKQDKVREEVEAEMKKGWAVFKTTYELYVHDIKGIK